LTRAFPVGLAAALGAVALLSIASFDAMAQTAAEWDQVIAAAKKEGKVVIYSGDLGAPANKRVPVEFEKKYGIGVQMLEGRGSDIRERMRLEQANRNYTVDVLHFVTSTTTTMIGGEGGLVKYAPVPGLDRLRDDLPFTRDEFQIPVFTINYGILVNRNLVKPGAEPKNWTDLLDPKWRAKILADDFRVSGGGGGMFEVMLRHYGLDFHKTMATQNVTFSRELRQNELRVARGEYAIYAPFNFIGVRPLKSLPVAVIIPTDGCTSAEYSVTLVNGAPHPNAARLLMHFYLSDEIQALYAEQGNGTVVKGMDSIADDLKPYVLCKSLGMADPARVDEMRKLATEMYK
jgi:iron(III) transport system substrate-binding protein